MEPRQLPLPQASQSSQRLPLGTGPHLGHTGGEHPLCFRAWLCAPFLGALGGAGGGHEWAGHWMETRQVSGRCGLLRAGCPPAPGLPRVSSLRGSSPKSCGPGSWLSCPWELGRSVQTTGPAQGQSQIQKTLGRPRQCRQALSTAPSPILGAAAVLGLTSPLRTFGAEDGSCRLTP